MPARMRPLAALLSLIAGATTVGCASGPRATLDALSYRAQFDLGCSIQAMQLHHVDDRTKVVSGCGRRLVYVEDCQSRGMSQSCSWMLDTPTFAQQSWPQVVVAPAPAAPAAPRAIAQPIAQPIARPIARPIAGPPPGQAAPSGRPIRTDLDGASQGVIATPNAGRRPVQTDLFDPNDERNVLDHRR